MEDNRIPFHKTGMCTWRAARFRSSWQPYANSRHIEFRTFRSLPSSWCGEPFSRKPVRQESSQPRWSHLEKRHVEHLGFTPGSGWRYKKMVAAPEFQVESERWQLSGKSQPMTRRQSGGWGCSAQQRAETAKPIVSRQQANRAMVGSINRSDSTFPLCCLPSAVCRSAGLLLLSFMPFFLFSLSGSVGF